MNGLPLIDCVHAALLRIDHPRYYESERGFQGKLLTELESQSVRALVPPGSIIEQEHQKRLLVHGLQIRPDIIIHEPFDPVKHADRSEGNIAVIELKRSASETDAVTDIEKLTQMMEILLYPQGIFINISSERTYAEHIPAAWRGRIVCFSVWLAEGRPVVRLEN